MSDVKRPISSGGLWSVFVSRVWMGARSFRTYGLSNQSILMWSLFLISFIKPKEIWIVNRCISSLVFWSFSSRRFWRFPPMTNLILLVFKDWSFWKALLLGRLSWMTWWLSNTLLLNMIFNRLSCQLWICKTIDKLWRNLLILCWSLSLLVFLIISQIIFLHQFSRFRIL